MSLYKNTDVNDKLNDNVKEILDWIGLLAPAAPAATISDHKVAPTPQHLRQRQALHCAAFICPSKAVK